MYLNSISTQLESDDWLIDPCASFHMTPHREWFYEYERYNVDISPSHDRPSKVIGHGRVKFILNDGRIKALPGVLHISDLAKNLVTVSKIGDVGFQNVLKKDRHKTVRGVIPHISLYLELYSEHRIAN